MTSRMSGLILRVAMVAWSASSSMIRVGQLTSCSRASSSQSRSFFSTGPFFLTTRSRHWSLDARKDWAFGGGWKSCSALVIWCQSGGLRSTRSRIRRVWVCRRSEFVTPDRTMNMR